jgi:outer membrane receptor protein involved in Fe transport
MTSSYMTPIGAFSPSDTIEAGLSARTDHISQSQKRLAIADSSVTLDEVDATIQATDVAGYLDLALHPLRRLTLRAGARIDGLSYAIEDKGAQGQGQRRSSQGSHLGKKATVSYGLAPSLNLVVSYGEGFRSPQARSLAEGQTTPFTSVISYEAGVRYQESGLRASAALFRTLLSNDLVFDQATARNENTPATRRTGLTAEMAATPLQWINASASATYTRAEFRSSDANYNEGDLLPYAPQIVMRSDLSLSKVIGAFSGRELSARVGSGMTYMGRRPLPYGEFGHDIFLVDCSASLRWKEFQLIVDVFNLLNANWYDGEFVYASNFHPGSSPSLIPQRHVTVGAPRTLLATLALYL